MYGCVLFFRVAIVKQGFFFCSLFEFFSIEHVVISYLNRYNILHLSFLSTNITFFLCFFMLVLFSLFQFTCFFPHCCCYFVSMEKYHRSDQNPRKTKIAIILGLIIIQLFFYSFLFVCICRTFISVHTYRNS